MSEAFFKQCVGRKEVLQHFIVADCSVTEGGEHMSLPPLCTITYLSWSNTEKHSMKGKLEEIDSNSP